MSDDIQSPIENNSYLQPEKNRPTESPVPPKEQQFEAPKEQEPQTMEIKSEGFLEESINSIKNKLRATKKKPTTIPSVRDAVSVSIEKVMAEGLEDAYKELNVIQKQEFKIKGEETAMQIRDLLRAGHVQLKKIYRLIVEWLKLLPGINRFFLEQEAKIKTDKILALKKIRNSKPQ